MLQNKGPIEDRQWPTRLDAHVVRPGALPALHGYDVHADLARFYAFGELILLSLTGDVPEKSKSRAFDAAMIFAAPVAIGEAPTHAATLARLCGARTAAIVSVAATALADQARETVEKHAAFLTHLASGESDLKKRFLADDESERQAVESLRVALGPFRAQVPMIERDLCLDAAIIAVLYACGLKRPEQIEIALCVSRLAPACAEALAVKAGDFRSYPMDLPDFDYEPRS